MAASIVRTRGSAPEDPASQIAWVQAGSGTYSHDEELPLKLRVKHVRWFCRAIVVTTLEVVWYKDAVTYIEIPAGFRSDLASVPRLVWALVSPWDIALEALFHDLLYQQQIVKRRVADQTLLSMMEDRRVPWLVRWTVYLGVRVGGWAAWRKHARENAAKSAK